MRGYARKISLSPCPPAPQFSFPDAVTSFLLKYPISLFSHIPLISKDLLSRRECQLSPSWGWRAWGRPGTKAWMGQGAGPSSYPLSNQLSNCGHVPCPRHVESLEQKEGAGI